MDYGRDRPNPTVTVYIIVFFCYFIVFCFILFYVFYTVCIIQNDPLNNWSILEKICFHSCTLLLDPKCFSTIVLQVVLLLSIIGLLALSFKMYYFTNREQVYYNRKLKNTRHGPAHKQCARQRKQKHNTIVISLDGWFQCKHNIEYERLMWSLLQATSRSTTNHPTNQRPH